MTDASGDTVTDATDSITVAIGANPATGTLSGTATGNAGSGVATFTGLNIDNVGTGYTLTASADGLTIATSASFDILTPTEGIAQIQTYVVNMVSEIAGVIGPKGIRNALTVKLAGAIAALDKGKNDLAVNKLNVFINFASGLEGKKLSGEQADDLVGAAQVIICVIEPCDS